MSRFAVALVAIVGAAIVAACGSDPDTLDPQFRGNDNGTGAPGSVTEPGAAPAASSPADKTPPPGVTDNKAKTFFVQTVYPSLMGTCGGCHSPPGSAGAPTFLSKTSASDAYTSVEARGYIVPSSMLVRKGSHQGPALTNQQNADVTNWLLLESQVRGAQTPVNLLAKLGNCLDQTKFKAILLQDLRTIKRKDENANNCTGCDQAPCQTCHQQGEYAMHSNFGKLGMATFPALQANATSPEGIYIASKYITTNGTTLVPSTALKDKATVTATGAKYSHPMFQISTTMDAAITAFAQDAITKYNAKQCGQ